MYSCFNCCQLGSQGHIGLEYNGLIKVLELDVHVTEDSYGWGLWQQLERTCQPIGFWSQLWNEADVWYTLTEKHLAPVYHALLAMEPITGTAPIKVITTYPIVG